MSNFKASKTAILTISQILNSYFGKSQSLQALKMAIGPLKSLKIFSRKKLRGGTFLKFPHCA